MAVEVKEVTGKAGLNDFINFTQKHYAGNKFWVPMLRFDEENTLKKEKNPAFDDCEAKYWLAYKEGKIVGRIAGILNKAYIEKWKNQYVRFGWMEFIDDKEVSKALLNAVESWAKSMGMEAVHGPLGFTDLDPEGLLVDGYDQMGNMASIYNYPYYNDHLANLGYVKDTDWLEFESPVPDVVPEKVKRLAELIKKKYNLRVLKSTKTKDILPYAHPIFDLINLSYAHLYGVTALTDKQIDNYVKQFFGFIRHEFVSVVLDENNEVVAFAFCMPSLSKALQKSKGKLFPFGFIHIMRAMKKNDRVDLYLVAVHPKYQNKGLNAILMDELTTVFIKNKIKIAEAHHQLEDNTKVHALWDYYDSKQSKRRRCYIKQLK